MYTIHFPFGRLSPTRGIVAGALFSLLVGFAGAKGVPAQDHEQPSDWATDNLDLVSASAAQIRDVLGKNPGLMVELKRLMAKQAIERGQIVTERDMTDSAMLDRLENDARFRALATRLLQRYAYLTPQINEQSPQGQEEELARKARAARIARAATDLGAESGPSATPSYPITVQASQPTPPPNPAAPIQPGNEMIPPDIQRPDLGAPSLITASAVSPAGPAKANPQPVSHRPDDLIDVTAGMPAFLPEFPDKQAPDTIASRGQPQTPVISEPVAWVKSPNPYAAVPSLNDLYVQAAPRTGQLERFGLQVFRQPAASTGIPMDLPAGPEYVLGPGDGLTIDLWGGVSQRLFRTVDREGRLSLPEAGPLLVSGRTLGEVQEVMQRILRTQYRDVSADISLGRLRTVRVYVVGEVASPGAYDISSLSTPLNALFAAGGVTPRGSLRLLRHYRGRQHVEDVDVYDLLLRGICADLKNLENGDTLLVPPVGPLVSMDGMVRRPAVYELRGETNLAEALDLAGGVLPAASLRHIEVQRVEAHDKRTMLSLNLDITPDLQALRHRLAAFNVRDGDEVHVFPIAPYNSAEVYLQGHVLRPGRYAYTPGMHVPDLVASYQDLLPEPAKHYAEIIRLRQPDWRPEVESFDLEMALANPAASPKLEPLDTVRIFGRYDLEAAPVIWLSGEVRSPGQYKTSGQMHLRDAIYQAGGLLPDAALESAQLFRAQPDGSLRILDVNLAAALDDDPLENILVQPRDRIVVHRSLLRVDPPSVYVEGEVVNPGQYPLAADMRLEDLLRAAGGPKRSADLKGADLTRYHSASGATPTGEHKSVDLTALSHDSSRNFSLHDGDVLSVPQLPGWNDLGATVTLKGEVRNPGVYGIRPGERLSSVFRRAGGLLPTAYPQGVVFTRNSVRELQEKSRQDLIQRLEQETPTVRTAVTASGTEEAALQAEATQQRERALEALRRAPVTGRMVIRLQPGLKGLEHSVQDIELRHGDSIEIPKQPGFVLVVGQVYNTNVINYVPRKNADWYLVQGGGATRLADKGAIFIVRADGEVVSRHGNEWWSGNVLSAHVSGRHPGRPRAAGAGQLPVEERDRASADSGSRRDHGGGVPMSGKAHAITLGIVFSAILPARAQDMTLKQEPTEAASAAVGAEGRSSLNLDNAEQWIKRFAGDEGDLWASPARARYGDRNWLLMLGGAAAGLLAADHTLMQHNTLSALNRRRSVDFSNLGVGALVSAGGALYLWGKKTGDAQEQETGLLSGESAVDALSSSLVLQAILGREGAGRGGEGRFFRGGRSFPSEHSAVAWSVASMIAHQYPGPLTKLFAYGLAGAVSVSRVTGNQHFPSDVLVGGAIGWLASRQVYGKHHDPTLGGDAWGGPSGSNRGEESQKPQNLASPYVPLDSWIYPDLERLAALGYIHTEFLSMRPWTRTECGRLVEEAGERIREDESENTEANRIYGALEREFSPPPDPPGLDPAGTEPSRSLQVESIYTRMMGISGQPLNDSYHFGQTLINDFGRPYAQGFDPVTGFSGFAAWGRFALYARGEYQHSPAAAGYSQSVQNLIAQLDGTPVQPAHPVAEKNQTTLLDTYALTRIANWNFSFGPQSLWWGPNRGGSLLLSDNAEPICMFRVARDVPFTLPWMFGRLGPMKVEAFFGQLAGNHFPPRPLLHGERLSLKPTENLELGFSRTAEFGGAGRPLTFGSLLNTYFSLKSSVWYPAWDNPGQRNGGFDISYRTPGLRNWLALYATLMSRDDPTPLFAFFPVRALMSTGFYVSHFPHLPRLDFRFEAVTTDPRNGGDKTGKFAYWEVFYRDEYTNKNNLIGDWIGRVGTGYQGWSTYWFSPRTSLEFGYRHAQVASTFIPHGGTLNDGSVKVNHQIGGGLCLSALLQYEQWLVSVLAPQPKNNMTGSLQLTYWPRHWGASQ